MTLAEDVVRLLANGADGALEFPDHAITRLVALVSEHSGDVLVDDARELVRLAHFLDQAKRAPRAAATLMTVAAAIADRVQLAVDASRPSHEDTTSPRATLASFRGDERVQAALASDAPRPPGTIPAGPGARFSASAALTKKI